MWRPTRERRATWITVSLRRVHSSGRSGFSACPRKSGMRSSERAHGEGVTVRRRWGGGGVERLPRVGERRGGRGLGCFEVRGGERLAELELLAGVEAAEEGGGLRHVLLLLLGEVEEERAQLRALRGGGERLVVGDGLQLPRQHLAHPLHVGLHRRAEHGSGPGGGQQETARDVQGCRVRRPMPASTEEAAGPETRARGAADASGRGALLVGAGILLSRILGLVRERVFAHYFGSSAAAAAFRAAQRIPNFLQNLLGEGVLSASFIPVYAELLAVGNEEEADRLAGIIFGMLALTTSLLVAVGVMFTPALLSTVASGFQGESRELALVLLRIAFPGTGLLVMCAWCLGILNSHRKFFLSYVAPVVWNVAQIATMLALGRGRELSSLAVWVTWATVAGALAQLLVQFPTALGLLGRFRPALSLMRVSARRVLRSFWPVVVARGVVQLSAYLDIEYTSLISNRAYAVLSAAQILYLLPVSLFGMSVSAAELPELSRERGTPE